MLVGALGTFVLFVPSAAHAFLSFCFPVSLSALIVLSYWPWWALQIASVPSSFFNALPAPALWVAAHAINIGVLFLLWRLLRRKKTPASSIKTWKRHLRHPAFWYCAIVLSLLALLFFKIDRSCSGEYTQRSTVNFLLYALPATPFRWLGTWPIFPLLLVGHGSASVLAGNPNFVMAVHGLNLCALFYLERKYWRLSAPAGASRVRSWLRSPTRLYAAYLVLVITYGLLSVRMLRQLF